MTPSGIEPATFRFVAQRLNHCATAVPVVNTVAAWLLYQSIFNLMLNSKWQCFWWIRAGFTSAFRFWLPNLGFLATIYGNLHCNIKKKYLCWTESSCILIHIYRRSVEICCSYICLPWKWGKYLPSKALYISMRLNHVISKNNVYFGHLCKYPAI